MNDDKILLYQPTRKARMKKSAFYGVAVFSRMLALCSDYYARSIKKPLDVATTDSYINIFWRSQFESSFTSLYVTGRDKLKDGETYVFMSNHESWMDIPAIFGAVPQSLRMVSKAGLMKVPVLGHAMTSAGFIAVDRKNRSTAIRQLETAKVRLRGGISIWIAPEGTRTRSGVIGPFKKGGFYLARELEMPIVPVFIEGARDVMPADGIAVYPNRSITVHFCEPISREEILSMDSLGVMQLARSRIIDKQQECLRG